MSAHRSDARHARRRATLLAAIAVVVVAGCAAYARWQQSVPGRATAPRPDTAVVPQPSDAERRERDIAFYAARARRDPSGAADLAHLAGLYLERSRETGDPSDFVRAETIARRSLHNRAAHNAAAAQVLVSSLLSQHRFAEALGVAKRSSERDPNSASLRAAVGEIQMELGQYAAARATFAGVRAAPGDLAVLPRLARWNEIEGHTDAARRLMRAALDAALREPMLPGEQLAWFWMRAGDIELRAGRPAAADSAYMNGLAAHPGDYRLLSALARTAAMRRDWSAAHRYGEAAIASNLDPATLGTLSDAAAALGDTAGAAEYARVLDVAVLRQPGAYHRAWSLFLLDHGRHVETVYAKVRNELRTRRDVYGYDLLAWALHARGRGADAARAMMTAMSQGTQDAQLFRHAAVIEQSLGHIARADTLDAHARTLDPFLPPLAHRTLASTPVAP